MTKHLMRLTLTKHPTLRVGSNGKLMFDEIYVFSDIHVVEFWVKQEHIFLASGGFGILSSDDGALDIYIYYIV